MSEGGDGIYPSIFRLWAENRSPREISDVTGVPIKEVYRFLRQLEKDLVKEKGVDNYEQEIHI